MKKFLTVLLVIAVMFTFSFGSAFADVQTGLTDAQQAAYDEAVGPNGVLLSTAFERAWKELSDPWEIGTEQYPVSKKVFDGFKSEALKAVEDEVYQAAAGNSDASTLKGMFDSSTKIKDIVVAALGAKLAQAQFNEDYANTVAKLDTIVPADYEKSSDVAQKIADLKAAAAAEAKKIDSDSTVANCKTAAGTVADLLTNAGVEEIKYQLADGKEVGSGLYQFNEAKSGFKKVATSEADKAADAARRAALKAIVAQNVAEYQKATRTPDTALMAAYTEAYGVRIDEDVDKLPANIKAVNDFTGTKLIDNYNLVQDLVAFAEKYKAERDADGNLVRDAKAIDDIVAAAKKAAYTYSADADPWDGTDLWDGTFKDDNNVTKTARTEIIAATLESGAKGLSYAKEYAKANMANIADNEYYTAEQTTIDAIVAEFNTKVDAATKTSDVKTLFNTYKPKVTAVDDKNAVNTNLQKKTAYGSAKTSMIGYVDFYNSSLTDTGKKLDKSNDPVNDVLCAYYGENGARTEAQIKELRDGVFALVEKLPTAEAQAAAKKAAIDAINVIPSRITLSDEATIQAAVDAADAYAALYGNQIGSYLTTLTTAENALADAYRVDLYKKSVLINKTDKAAVKAMKAEYDAANAKDCVGNMDLGNDYEYKSLVKALETIRTNEKNAVIKAINAIPVNVTEADKAVVEAARKAYDAYVEEYTDYVCHDTKWGVDGALNCDAAKDFDSVYRELALAEAALGLNDNPAATVKALKIKASSSAKKGSITVKWTVTGDASKVDGYEVWKSTKHSSGYKKAFTTTKKSYKNTKGLKKGTRYYYKVRAYANIDGKKVTSDWSNKARRIAK